MALKRPALSLLTSAARQARQFVTNEGKTAIEKALPIDTLATVRRGERRAARAEVASNPMPPRPAPRRPSAWKASA
jgi:hypothetical protein